MPELSHRPSDPADRDAAVRAALLDHLLRLYPAWLSDGELACALGPQDADAVRRAARDLVADGLLHRRDGFVVPTRAAVRCAEVLSGEPACVPS